MKRRPAAGHFMMPCNTVMVYPRLAPAGPESHGDSTAGMTMGLLDSVIGALSGIRSGTGRGDTLEAVLGMLADDGPGPGMGPLIGRFEQRGLSHVMASWVGPGENLPIAPETLQQVLGDDAIAQVAQKLGLPPRVTCDRLSQMLPYVVDKLTPDGEVPANGFGDVGELMGRIGRG